MTNPTKLFVLALVACLFTSCAGMTAAETSGVIVTGAGALVGFIEALSPMLSPEQQAQLTAMAGNVQTVVEASTTAVGQVAAAIAELKQQQADEAAGTWTSGETTGLLTGVTAAGVAVSRAMSWRKHRPQQPAAAA